MLGAWFNIELTNLPLDEMPTISLKFVSKDLFDNNPALVSIMAWCRIGNKPLTDAYIRTRGGGGGLNVLS